MADQNYSTDELMVDVENLLLNFQKEPELIKNFEKDPKTVMKKLLPERSKMIDKTWDNDVEQSFKGMFSNISPEKKSDVAAITLSLAVTAAGVSYAAAAVSGWVVCSWAAKKWAPWSYSEHPIIIDQDKIQELLEKEIISKDDLIRPGHRGIY